jgi:cell division protein FtsL
LGVYDSTVTKKVVGVFIRFFVRRLWKQNQKAQEKRDRQNTEFINSNLRRKLMTLKMNI